MAAGTSEGASALKKVRSFSVAGRNVPDYGFFLIIVVAVILLAREAILQPTEFVQVSVFGLADGSMYALVALGYTMVTASSS